MVLRANRIAVSAGDHGIRGDLPQRCKDTYRDPNASNRKSPIRSSNRQQFQRILRHCPCGGSLSQLAGNIEAIINVPRNRPVSTHASRLWPQTRCPRAKTCTFLSKKACSRERVPFTTISKLLAIVYTAAKTTRCQPYWRRLLRWPEHCMFEGSSSGISGKLRTQRNRSGDCVWTLNHNLSSHKKTIISREKPGPINLSES